MDINLISNEKTSCIVDSSEYLRTPNQDGVKVDFFESEAKPQCRICHSSSENLIRPCDCKGTIEHVHQHCLERWLEEKNTDFCDLCQHQFQTKRSRKGFREMLGDRDMRKYVMIYCTFMAIVISPFIAATCMFWISTKAFVYYIQKYGWTIYTASAIFLPFALGVGVTACFCMIIVCTRDFVMEFKDWRNRNWNIRIVDRLRSDIDNAVIIPRETTQDLTFLTEQPGIRYGRDMNGADYVAIIGIAPPENTTIRQEKQHNEPSGHIV